MLSDEQIRELAEAMPRVAPQPNFIDAGYTYLGQFISHELVPETHPQRCARRVVTPYLDLDSLYGQARHRPQLFDEDGLFKITRATNGGPDDLPRIDGVAQIPEPRNDDNVIVSQLHLFWQRLHNFVVSKGYASGPDEARRIVTLVVQLLVVEDFLQQILAKPVFDSYFRDGDKWLGFDPSRIPRDFSHAAFRFGHSMVRSSYKSFPNHDPVDVPLEELLRANQNLTHDLVIDWAGFFGWPNKAGAQRAMAIDPLISLAMQTIPRVHRGSGQPVNVVEVNLRAGNEARLPSGRDYVLALPREVLSTFKLSALADLGAELQLNKNTSINVMNLPLWPYVLAEAFQTSSGARLGTLGSLICAEVLANAIRGAPDSIYKEGDGSVEQTLNALGAFGQAVRDRMSEKEALLTGERPFCMRLIVDLVTNPGQSPGVSEMENDELTGWVAEEGDVPSVLIDPVWIDYRAVEDLLPYHPGYIGAQPYTVRLFRAQDEEGKLYAGMDSLSSNWSAELTEVAQALRLYPTEIKGFPVLIDQHIGTRSNVLMHAWKVVEWMVVKNINSDGVRIHQDIITWEKNGSVAKSAYSWRPYAPAPPPSNAMAESVASGRAGVRGGAIHLHFHNF
jgi:Animal haem peroxidase